MIRQFRGGNSKMLDNTYARNLKTSSTKLLPAFIFCLFAVSFLFGCSSKSNKSDMPNVLLVTIDALRADHVGCYGYSLPTTPFIDDLAARGTVFEDACAVACFSGPSYASILTGTFPFTHTIRDHPQFMPDECLTLAEILRDRGYYTIALVHEKHFLDEKWNYSQGFRKYVMSKNGRDNTEDAIKRLSSLKQPFFMWLFYNEPHFRYEPPKPFDQKFGQRPDGYSLIPDLRSDKINKQELSFSFEKVGLSPEDARYTLSLYDGEIAYTDHLLSKVFEKMKELGIVDNTLIVITADHGECLGEDSQYFTHDSSLSQATLHVPLIFYLPGTFPPGSRVEQVVRSVDIAPTILAAISASAPAVMEGQSLLPALQGKNLTLEAYAESRWLEPTRAVLNLMHYPIELPGIEGKWRAIRSGKMKLVRIPTKSGVEYRLYDLAADPKEQHNLSGERPAEFEKMKQRMDELIRNDTKPSAKGELDERDIEALRSLGYIN